LRKAFVLEHAIPLRAVIDTLMTALFWVGMKNV
jgi:hypothetical protein